MGLPGVTIDIQGGGLGLTVRPADRVMGIVFHGDTTTTPNQPAAVFSVDDFKTYLSTRNGANSTKAIQAVQDFYDQAGTGAELWVTFLASTITAGLAASGPVDSLLMAADGRINVLGFQTVSAATAGAGVGYWAEGNTNLAAANTKANAYAALGMPFRVLMDGAAFSGNAADLVNLRSQTYNRVAVLLSTIRPNTVQSAVGAVLGRLAATAPNVSLGRTKNGSFAPAGYLTDTSNVATRTDLGLIHDKGYIVLRKHVGLGGVYLSSDATATLPSDDYSKLTNGRVIDKAHRITYQAFIEELLDTVTVNESTGRIVSTTLKYYESKIEQRIGLAMAGEISGVDAFVDPAQNFLSTGELKVQVSVVPTGSNEKISIKLGLKNPQAA